MNAHALALSVLLSTSVPFLHGQPPGGLPARIEAGDATLSGLPAKIEVLSMKATTLRVTQGKDGWLKVPEFLTKQGAVIYMPTGPANGVSDFKVTGDGLLLLACNYDYQGNKSGNWEQDVWKEEDFKSHGWKVVEEAELGGQLVSGYNRAQIIFAKQVRRGETFRLRCNKYDPPFPILLNGRGASVAFGPSLFHRSAM